MPAVLVVIFSFFALIFPSFSAEFRYGYGTFSVKNKIFGFSNRLEDKVSVFSISEFHKNVLSSGLFYGYNLSYILSEKEKKILDLYNSSVEPFPTDYKPVMEYRLEGFDGQLEAGYDFIKKNNYFLGIGGLLGISLPYIRNYNAKNNSQTTLRYLPDSKTKIKTYRVGISVKGAYKLFQRIYLKSGLSYGWQTGKVKNSLIGINSSVNGEYGNVYAGIDVYLLKEKVDLGIFSLSPQLYFSFGYIYEMWKLKDVNINNNAISINRDNLKIENSYLFSGIGYSF